MMAWPDLVIALSQGMFVVALAIAVFKPEKPPVATSAMTALGLLAIAVALGASGLLLGAVTSTATGLLWFVLMMQARITRR